MKVSLHSEFIGDLISIGDAKVPSRILRKLFDKSGSFIEQAKDDHRYHGIDGGWIRYVSQGGAAFRVIYTRSGDDVLIYRAGPHAVEDRLTPPSQSAETAVVDSAIRMALGATVGERSGVMQLEEAKAATQPDNASGVEQSGSSRLLLNHAERLLYANLLGRRFLPHKDVYLVSPYLSHDLLRSTHQFGQMLDDLIDGGATVWLICNPPRVSEVSEFERLAARNINVFFSEHVHAKVYAFILNRDLLKPDQRAYQDFVAVGSANLTWPGINPNGLRSDRIQYELSYQVPAEDWADVERFVLHVTGLSTELDVLRATLVQQ